MCLYSVVQCSLRACKHILNALCKHFIMPGDEAGSLPNKTITVYYKSVQGNTILWNKILVHYSIVYIVHGSTVQCSTIQKHNTDLINTYFVKGI